MQCLMSYDDRSVYNIRSDPITHASKNATYFFAFNPIIDRSQAGSLFSTYLNMYRYMKFVGLKVKWKPNSDYHNAFAYNQNADGSVATTTIVQDLIPALPTGCAQVGTVQFLTPSELYFNVVFQKDYYEEYAWPLQCLNISYNDQAVIPAGTAYVPPQEKYNPFTVMKRFKLFDQYDQQQAKVKKFPLSKPFKFYVRPYDVSYGLT